MLPNTIVSESEGLFVTSKDPQTEYYVPKASTYWQTWKAENRVWFRRLDDLLAAYPDRRLKT